MADDRYETDWKAFAQDALAPDSADRMRTRLRESLQPDQWRCSTPDCPGDPNYAPPGKGHLPGCHGVPVKVKHP